MLLTKDLAYPKIYKAEQFHIKKYIRDCGIAPHHRQYNQGRKQPKLYVNAICSFDIETTNDTEHEQAFMYVWMFSINDNAIIGRTWKEYLKLCADIDEVCEAEDMKLIVHVHNLSYEFHFLRGIMQFDSVFATKPRKIIRAEAYHMEYRCTYFLTHLSLAKLTKKYNVKHAKSEMDYSVYRTPTTKLTSDEMTYIINDVIGLSEAMICQMNAWNDDLYSCPMTQTGYVRREVKKRLKQKNPIISRYFPSYEVYTDLLAAFRGGNTHANRHFVGKIIENVHNIDIASSYPAQMLFKKFPMSDFHELQVMTEQNIADILQDNRYALLMRVRFFELTCSDSFGVPYLSKSKCIVTDCIEDNGRVLYAEYCETVITDIDQKIINQHYTYNAIDFVTIRYSRYGYLYQDLTDFIKELFKNKTELKGVDDDLYMRSKEMINSVYGLCAEKTLHDSYELIDNKIEKKEIEDILEAYARKAKYSYKLYAWGVWVTAHARNDLQDMINHVHKYGKFLYADTDSVKYVGNVPIEKYNAPLISRAREHGATGITQSGKEKQCGIWELEDDYKRFTTVGAKKYAYEDDEGKLHITIAGIGKAAGAHELEMHGGLETLAATMDTPFTFNLGGGTGATFNDDTYMAIDHEGEKITITPNMYIYDDTATVCSTSEYQQLVKQVQNEMGLTE